MNPSPRFPSVKRRDLILGLLSSVVLPSGVARAQTVSTLRDIGETALSEPLYLPPGSDLRGSPITKAVRPARSFAGEALVVMPGGVQKIETAEGLDTDNQGLSFIDGMQLVGDGSYTASSGFKPASMSGILCGNAVAQPYYAMPFELSRLRFYGLSRGIDLRVALESHIRDCVFRACGTGIYIGATPDARPVNAMTISGGHFRKCLAGIEAPATALWNHIRVENATLEANIGPALSLRRSNSDRAYTSFVVENCWFEQNGAEGWDIEADYDGSLVLRDCTLALSSTQHNGVRWVGRYDFGRCDVAIEGGSIVANAAKDAVIRSRGRLTFRGTSTVMRGKRAKHIGLDLGGTEAAAAVTYEDCRLEMISHLSPASPQTAPTVFRGFTRFGGLYGDSVAVTGAGFVLAGRRLALIENRADDPGYRREGAAAVWRASPVDPPQVGLEPVGASGARRLLVAWRGGAQSSAAGHNMSVMRNVDLAPGALIATSLSLSAETMNRRVRLEIVDEGTGMTLCRADTVVGQTLQNVLLVGRNESASGARCTLILSVPDLAGSEGFVLRATSPQCLTGDDRDIQPVLRGDVNPT